MSCGTDCGPSKGACCAAGSCPCPCKPPCCPTQPGSPCGPVFIIIRFPQSRALACKNSLSKHMSIHNNYSGIVSGISHTLCVVGGYWPYNNGVAILSFESLREAELWKDSVPEIKQHDWMDGVDMIIVPVRTIPPAHKRFVELQDLRFQDVPGYLCQLTKVIEQCEETLMACRCSVSTCCIRVVKGLWNPHHLVLNFWPSEEAFCKSQKILQEKMACMCCYADIHSVAFYLHPLCNYICGDNGCCYPPPPPPFVNPFYSSTTT